MINENLSKICEFGIWLIQWFGDFSKDIKALQIRNLNSTIQFLVAPPDENQAAIFADSCFFFYGSLYEEVKRRMTWMKSLP